MKERLFSRGIKLKLYKRLLPLDGNGSQELLKLLTIDPISCSSEQCELSRMEQTSGTEEWYSAGLTWSTTCKPCAWTFSVPTPAPIGSQTRPFIPAPRLCSPYNIRTVKAQSLPQSGMVCFFNTPKLLYRFNLASSRERWIRSIRCMFWKRVPEGENLENGILEVLCRKHTDPL